MHLTVEVLGAGGWVSHYFSSSSTVRLLAAGTTQTSPAESLVSRRNGHGQLLGAGSVGWVAAEPGSLTLTVPHEFGAARYSTELVLAAVTDWAPTG